MADYIDREAAEELLSQPITMSMCLTVGECEAKKGQREIDLYLLHSIPAADVVTWEQLKKAWQIATADVVDGSLFRDCRNELCLRCGQYKERHLGACDGCRWMEVQDGG